MLQVTQEAMTALKEARTESGAPQEAGVRFQAEETAENRKAVHLNFQKDPEPTDQTIETMDLRVFVAKELVEPLSDRTLDVRATPQGPRLTLR